MQQIFYDLLEKNANKAYGINKTASFAIPIGRKETNHVDFWFELTILKEADQFSLTYLVTRTISSQGRVLSHRISDNAVDLLPEYAKKRIREFFLEIIFSD